MSFGVQTSPPIAIIGELALAATEGEETHQIQQTLDTNMPEPKGEMKTPQKQYTLSQQHTTTSSQQLRSYIQHTGAKNSVKLPDNSPMRLASMTYQRSSSPSGRPTTQSANTKATTQSFTSGQPATGKAAGPASGKATAAPHSPLASHAQAKTNLPTATNTTPTSHKGTQSQAARPTTHTRGEQKSERSDTRAPSLQARSWKKEETNQWWQERYHQKERDGQRQDQGQDQEQTDKRKKNGVAGVSAAISKQSSPQASSREIHKPILQKPKTGVFALYYILTKIGIHSDGTSNFSYKKEIEMVDTETTTAHKKRLDELKEAIDREHAAAKWGVATKVFSWLGSLFGIVAGAALIATGVGAVAGAMMIAGGLIQITNELLEITGGWKKIADLLPGDDPDQKRAVLNWMQIGITVLCLILSAVGVIWGGVGNFQAAMGTAQAALGGIAAMGHGVATIGEGVNMFMFKDKMGDVKRYDRILAELLHKRRDLMERVEWGVDRLEQLFEDLAKALEFEVELFRADQMVNR